MERSVLFACLRLQLIALALAVALGWSGATLAYEVSTHAYITHEAFRRSTLAPVVPNSLQARLGFVRFEDDNVFRSPIVPDGLRYFDNLPLVNDPAAFPRPPLSNYEEGLLRQLLLRQRLLGFGSADLMRYQTRLEGWLIRGAIREDDLTSGTKEDYDNDPHGNIMRPFSHFYDPIEGRSLGDLGIPGLCNTSTRPCNQSLNWAMGESNPLAMAPFDDNSRRNHFSWKDARNNLWWALTLDRDGNGDGTVTPTERMLNSQERVYRFATAIRSLGDVLHLLQDMAQPQHSRVDPHPPIRLFSVDRQIYENFTDQRVTYNFNPAHREESVLRLLDGGFPSLEQTPGPVIGNYPAPTFAIPRHFFTTRTETGTDSVLGRRGMGDYSNRGFLTAGTLPDSIVGFDFALPPPDFTTANGYSFPEVQTTLMVSGNVVRERLVSHAVPDSVAPAYVDASLIDGKAPLATESMWVRMGPIGGVTIANNIKYRLDLRNYVSMADMLLPRAVAYSTGMIDHFFRGKILIEAPEDGLFALTDQTMRHTVSPEGYPICSQDVPSIDPVTDDILLCRNERVLGFKRLRLKLRNDTAPIIESGTAGPSIPQDMASTSATPGAGDPQIVAVARYHRNACYQPGLDTERTVMWNNEVAFPDCALSNRTPYQEISVSKPIALPASQLNGTTSVPVAFNFQDDPIPINATDLIIQVVYRGPLGMERDGIAFGTFDIKEPTYLTLWNNSDYAGCNGAWVTSNVADCNYGAGGPVARTIRTARLCVGSQSVYERLETGGNGAMLPGGDYVRLAALLDSAPTMTRARMFVGTASTFVFRDRTLTAQVRQSLKEAVTTQAPYLPDPMYLKRGVVGSFRPLPFYLIIGADPQPTSDMGALDVGALAAPFTPNRKADGRIRFPEVPVPNPSFCITPPPTVNVTPESEAAAANP